MKSFLFSCSVGFLFAGMSLYSACAKADEPGTLTETEVSHCEEYASVHGTSEQACENEALASHVTVAPALSKMEISYCDEYADAHYHGPRDKKSNAPIETNEAFITLESQCEMQWQIVAAQWEPAYMNEIAVMAIAAGTAEGTSYAEAEALAKKYHALGVEQVGQDLWIPLAEDTHPGTVGGLIPFK